MVRKPPSDFSQITGLLSRRKLWILIPLLVVPPVIYVGSHFLPRQYTSQTMILVDPQKIPVEYVKATVTSDVTDRLQTISEEVMSRTRLETIAQETELYRDIRAKGGMDQVVAAMRKDITVDVIKGANDKTPVDGFKISYVASNPALAQKVTEKIADLFIAENLKERDQDAQGTESFIEDQLAKARIDLTAQEQKISAFKASHLGSLPEQENANLSMIGEYQSLEQANSEAIDRANQQKTYLQSMLNVSGGGKSATAAAAPTDLQLQLQTAEQQLATARQSYTEEYPDVVRLREQVAQLQQEVKHQPKNAPRVLSASGPNVSQQLESQLLSIQQEIKSRTARQAMLEGQTARLQGNVEGLPTVQSDFESLNRDYTEMQKNYESLLEKEQASGMAAELEHHNQSERFRILDPAGLPTAPSSPNLLLINGGGLAFALILGIVLAVVVDMRDGTMHNADEAEEYLSAPLIIALPTITLGPARSRLPWKKLAAMKSA
jgi:succinoglycan biosynthesis transport protein ExoP